MNVQWDRTTVTPMPHVTIRWVLLPALVTLVIREVEIHVQVTRTTSPEVFQIFIVVRLRFALSSRSTIVKTKAQVGQMILEVSNVQYFIL